MLPTIASLWACRALRLSNKDGDGVQAVVKDRTMLKGRCFLFFLVLFFFVFGTSSFLGQTSFFLRNNDHVVFYGDSITEQGLYGSYVETFVLSRFPDLHIRFTNSGWAGDWIVGGGGGSADKRMMRDVIALKPTVVTSMFGMNDAGYRDFDPSLLTVYSNGYQHVLDVLREKLSDTRLTLIQSSPFDDLTRGPQYAMKDGGYNKALLHFTQSVAEIGTQRNLPVCDFNTPLLSVIAQANSVDPKLAQEIIPDRIHPGPAGALVMAASLLKCWNAPGTVSDIEIDGAKGRVVRAGNSTVAQLQSKPILSWTQTDAALPLPVDANSPVFQIVYRFSPEIRNLDQQILKVTGLRMPRYALLIDGESIGTFSKEELAQGVILTVLATPMLRQSLELQALALRRNSVRLARWQGVQVRLEDEQTSTHVADALRALDELDEDLFRQEREAAISRPHHFALLPAPPAPESRTSQSALTQRRKVEP